MNDKCTKILLIEDNPGDARLIKELLKEVGNGQFVTETINRLSTALKRLDRGDVDVILLDLGLPDSQGLDTLKKMNTNAPTTPVVVITGLNDEEVAIEAMREGAQDYLIKDMISGEILHRVIRYSMERKRSEKALRESEENFRQFFENQPGYCYMVSLEGIILDVNKAALNALGYKKEELLGGDIQTIYAPESLPKVKQLFQLCKVTGHIKDEELVIISKEEIRRTVILNANIVKDSNGKILHSVSVQNDITERKLAEQKLIKSEEKYSNLVERCNDGIIVIQNGVLKYVNAKMLAITGFSLEEVIDKPFLDFAAADFHDLIVDRYMRRLSGQTVPNNYEIDVLGKDNSNIAVEVNASIIDYEGKPADMAILHDLTERKRAEEELRKSEEKYRLLAENATDVIWTMDINTLKFTYVSPSIERLTGYTTEEAMAMTLDKSLTPDSYDWIMHILNNSIKSAAEPGSNPYEGHPLDVRQYRKDGSTIFTESIGTLIYNANGIPTAIVGITRDITERKNLEIQLKQINRLYALLSEINQAIVKTSDRDELFQAACRIAVDVGKFRTAWVGILDRSKKTITRTAHHGSNLGFPLETLPVKGDSYAHVSIYQAINSGNVSIFNDLEKISLFWRIEALQSGFHSIAVIPVKGNGEVIATLSLYSDTPGFFSEEEQRLLQEISDDLSFAIESMETEKKRKQTEEKLNEETRRWQILIERSNDGIVILDKDGNVCETNQRFSAMLGYAPNEILTLHVWDWDIQWTRDEILEMIRDITKVGISFETRYRHRDGTTLNVEICTNTVMISGQKFIMCICHDITERKHAETLLKESEDRYRAIVENTDDGIILQEASGRIVTWNKTAAYIFGITEKEAISHTSISRDWNTIHEDGSLFPGTEHPSMYTLETGEPCNNVIMGIKKNPEELFWVNINTRPLFREGKSKPYAVVVSFSDITERKQIEEQIIKSKSLLQAVIDSTPDRIAVKDIHHRYLLVNKSLASSLNLKPQDIIGREDSEFYSKEQLWGNPQTGTLSMRENDEAALRGQIIHTANRMMNIDGTSQMFDAYRVPLTDTSGNIYGVLVYSRDITELQKSADELKKSYQLLQKTLQETVEALAAVCEIRDPYTAGHQVRVTTLACAIADEVGLSPEIIENIRIGGIIHDIGKMYVPAEILSKPGKLTETEFMLIKNHPQIGYDIVKKIDFPCSVAQIVLQHHERLDGSGYPKRLKRGEIILEAKILAVADVVEAMSSHRPYRPALGIEKALEEISKNKGILYDEKVADICFRLFTEKKFKF